MCEHCEVASTLGSRTKGLLGRSGLDPGHGLLITRTGSIHTVFMRFAIDAVYLDKQMTVRKIVRGIRPFRLSWSPGAKYVLELAAGEAERVGIRGASRLSWREP